MDVLDTPLRILQLIGLSLPAVALYMSVLTEIHMVTERAQTDYRVNKHQRDGNKIGDMIETERFNVRYTDAVRKSDFFFCLISLLTLLGSGFLLLLTIVFEEILLLRIGIGLTAAGFVLLGVGVVVTIFDVATEIKESN